MPFAKLGLSDPIINALNSLGYSQPTPIQTQAIPVALSGKNIIAAAQTGTGKTASFVLPILERFKEPRKVRGKRVKALVLAPTRELVVQVEQNIQQYSKNLSINSMVMYGGVDSKQQKQRLIEGIDILVATPGRLLDLYTQRAVHFDELEVLVLDEADRMLDMGFIEDINRIIELLPDERQNMLFSATLSNQVRALAKTAMQKPVQISVIADADAAPKIDQWLVTADKDKKSALLSHLIQENDWKQALIFIETKHGAAKLVTQLEKRGIIAESFHSGRSQPIREQILADFKAGKITYLIATGVAARGIDIDDLPLVINYDLPFPADDYVHRIGRTGRAGAQGTAVSLVSKDDFKNLCAIERRLGHIIERKEIEGFSPRKEVPISILDFVPKNPKTPKPKTDQDQPKMSRGKSDKPKNNHYNKNKARKFNQEEASGNSRSAYPAKDKNSASEGQRPQRSTDAKPEAVPNGSGSVNPWKQ
ncbi:DEAD/DEAH box helicase [Shewanella olleyana]|uniref:DEAD/DEAH box helicase n=1 Tax=Shewanella olleyana TaxID=135626 RepID=UPI00200E8EA9|nr:DEAD/DEAH box helicase [Shewanella olleyana]MCL1067939.1 DEAD/DEAH box helicase [Shewanella olleyana]